MHKIRSLLSSVNNKGFFHLLTSNFVVQFLGFAVIIYLPAVLSPEEVGAVRLLQTYGMLFILLGTFGYNVALLKTSSEDCSLDEKEIIFSYSSRRTIFFSLISYGLLLVVNEFYFSSVNEFIYEWAPIYGVIIPFGAIVYGLTAYLQALKKIKEVAIAQVIMRSILIVLIIIASYFWGFEGFVYSTIFSYVFGLAPFMKFIDFKIFFRSKTPNDRSRIDHYAYFTVLGVVITTLGQYADLYLLDYLAISKADLGVYAFATLFYQAGLIAINTIQSIVTPYISEKQNDLAWVWKKTVYYQLLSFGLSIILALGMYLTSYLLVEYYLGDDYRLLPYFTLGIIAKFMVWSSYSVLGASLVGLGKIKIGFYFSLITTPLSLLAGYALFDIWGVYGVIAGQVISTLFLMIGIWVYFWIITHRRGETDYN